MKKGLFLILSCLLLGAHLSCSQKQAAKHVVLIGLDGWASMLMGAGPELHGYTEWGSRVPGLPSCEVDQDGISSTIAYIFGLDQPQVWTSRPMTQVFK